MDTGSHSNQVYADCVDLSAVENASKQEARASVLILSEPIMLWDRASQSDPPLAHQPIVDDLPFFALSRNKFQKRRAHILQFVIELQRVPACCVSTVEAPFCRPCIPCGNHKRPGFFLLHPTTRSTPLRGVTLGRMFNKTLFQMRKDDGIGKTWQETWQENLISGKPGKTARRRSFQAT